MITKTNKQTHEVQTSQSFAKNGQALGLILSEIAKQWNYKTNENFVKEISLHLSDDDVYFFDKLACELCAEQDWCVREVYPTNEIHSGSLWQHVNGSVFEVVKHYIPEKNHTPAVLYKHTNISIIDNDFFLRPIDSFLNFFHPLERATLSHVEWLKENSPKSTRGDLSNSEDCKSKNWADWVISAAQVQADEYLERREALYNAFSQIGNQMRGIANLKVSIKSEAAV